MRQHEWHRGRILNGPGLLAVTAAALACFRRHGDGRRWCPSLEYNRDIRPILAENCFACHGPDSAARKADLRLDRREAAIEAGAIVPRRARVERADRADQRRGSQGADAAAGDHQDA